MYAQCYYHDGRGSVAGCARCTKGLCRDCAQYWDPATCPECVESQLSRERGHIIYLVVATAIFFVIGLLVPFGGWFFTISVAGIPAIYSAASLKDPLEDSVVFVWFFWWWYVLKLLLAFIFGSLGFLYVVYKAVKFGQTQRSYQEMLGNSPSRIVEHHGAPSEPVVSQPSVSVDASSFLPGTAVFARYSRDGWYYLASVLEVSGGDATVRFFDDIVETMPLERLRRVGETFEDMSAQAIASNLAYYRPCRIVGMGTVGPHVVFAEEHQRETVDLERLRFSPEHVSG